MKARPCKTTTLCWKYCFPTFSCVSVSNFKGNSGLEHVKYPYPISNYINVILQCLVTLIKLQLNVRFKVVENIALSRFLYQLLSRRHIVSI